MRGLAAVGVVAAAALSAGCAIAPTEEGLMRVLAPSAKVDLVRENFAFTEGPLPTPDGGLLFTDYRGEKIWRLDAKGNLSVFRERTNMTNGIAFMPNGDLVAVGIQGAPPERECAGRTQRARSHARRRGAAARRRERCDRRREGRHLLHGPS